MTAQRQKHHVPSEHYELLILPHNVSCQKIKILYISAVETDLTHNRILLYYVPPHNGLLDILLKQ
jgi:hypothetical protein